MVRGKYDVRFPDTQELTISLTMSVAEWRAIMREKPEVESVAGDELRNAVSHLLGQYERASHQTFHCGKHFNNLLPEDAE